MREFIDYQLPEKIESIKLGNIPDFDIEDYENYKPKQIIESFNDTLELGQYSARRGKQLKNLIDIILNFSFFKEECPLNFGFENNTNEDKSQSIFYEDEWCENNCDDNYKDCWLKYFKKLQKLEQESDSE